MDCKMVFNAIDALYDKYVGIWQDVCNIESPTKFKQGVDKVGEYFITLAKSHGWAVEVLNQTVSGNAICITMNENSSEAPVSLSGHMDTVQEVGSCGSPAVRIDDEKIYGPGTVDCKGGVVAGFMAMEALHKCGFSDRPIKLILQTDEETGSKTSRKSTIRYICEESRDALVFINLETHTPGKATLSRKGIVSYRFDITGQEGHSSRCVTEGANAIIDASYKMIELDKLKDDEGITCNCGVVSGGTVVNTIPGKCSFSVNFRYATEKQFEWIETFVRELSMTQHVAGCECEVTNLGERPAMEMKQENVEILEKVNKIFAENGVQTLEGRMLRGGSDASYITQYGIPCIDSLGTEGGKSHTVNEFAKIDSLAKSAKRVALIAKFIK